jgi:hypothetical protein
MLSAADSFTDTASLRIAICSRKPNRIPARASNDPICKRPAYRVAYSRWSQARRRALELGPVIREQGTKIVAGRLGAEQRQPRENVSQVGEGV